MTAATRWNSRWLHSKKLYRICSPAVSIFARTFTESGTEFAHYVHGLALSLNEARDFAFSQDDNRAITVTANSLQSAIRSVSLYPFAVVIERSDAPIHQLISAKRGTIWQPFLDIDQRKQ